MHRAATKLSDHKGNLYISPELALQRIRVEYRRFVQFSNYKRKIFIIHALKKSFHLSMSISIKINFNLDLIDSFYSFSNS